MITKNRYGWPIRNVGTLHLVNGIIIIPVSIFAGWLSQYREDRYLAMWFMGVTAVGMTVMIDFTDLLDVELSPAPASRSEVSDGLDSVIDDFVDPAQHSFKELLGVASSFTSPVIAHLPLLELAGVGAVALLLFFLQVSALGHAELRALISTFIVLNSIL